MLHSSMFVNTESYKETIRNEKRGHLYGNTGTSSLFAVDSSVSLVGCFLGFFLGLVLGRQQYFNTGEQEYVPWLRGRSCRSHPRRA